MHAKDIFKETLLQWIPADLPKFILALFVFALCIAGSRTVGAQSKVQSAISPQNGRLPNEEDKYQLIFADSYEGALKIKFRMIDAMVRTQRESFTSNMNRVGALGYKMRAAIPDFPMAIVGLDEGKYEYDWFEIKSSYFFARTGIEDKMEHFSLNGFLIADRALTWPNCDTPPLDDPIPIANCVYKDFFIVEKESEPAKRSEQYLARTLPGWKAHPSEDLTTELNQKAAEGFYPVKILSKFEILLQKDTDAEEIIKEKPEFRVIREGLKGGDVKKKIQELAKQGYRLALMENGIAVLFRNAGSANAAYSYAWLNTTKNNFEKDLAKLAKAGYRYRTVYSAGNVKNTLILEQTPESAAKPAEFRILKFDFDYKEDPTQTKVFVTLTDAGKNSLNQLNQLTKEGFQIKDLFRTDKITAILERDR